MKENGEKGNCKGSEKDAGPVQAFLVDAKDKMVKSAEKAKG